MDKLLSMSKSTLLNKVICSLRDCFFHNALLHFGNFTLNLFTIASKLSLLPRSRWIPSIIRLSKRSSFIRERRSLLMRRIKQKFILHSAEHTVKVQEMDSKQCSSEKASFNFLKYASSWKSVVGHSASVFLPKMHLNIAISHRRLSVSALKT